MQAHAVESAEVEVEARLVEDCKRIVSEAELEVFRKWHELGTRILKDEDFLKKRYGEAYAEGLADKINIGSRSIYRAIQFAKKYPVIETQSVTRDKITWRQFATEILPEKKRSTKPTAIPSTATTVPRGKKALYFCPWCKREREEYEISHVHGNTCTLCGNQVEVLQEKATEQLQSSSIKIPPIPFRETMKVNVSQAESDLGVALQRLKTEGKIGDIGETGIEIPIKSTWPDRIWTKQRIILYLDGDKVHDMDDPWDAEVKETLTKRGWIVLRERYTAPMSQTRLEEILGEIQTMLVATATKEAS